MNQLSKKMTVWLITILLIVLGVIIFKPVMDFARSRQSGPSIPSPFLGGGSRKDFTATPDATEAAVRSLARRPDFIAPTATLISFSKITDLSPDLTVYQKYAFVISRADGSFEKIFVGPIPAGDNSLNISDSVLKKLNLRPGDKVYTMTNPAGFIGRPTAPPIPEEIPVPTNVQPFNIVKMTPVYPAPPAYP
jgi:hypothetical protein